MMSFEDRLAAVEVDLEDTHVILHKPKSPRGDLLATLPQILSTRCNAFDVYQATHNAPAERTLRKKRNWITSFVKIGEVPQTGGSAWLFSGLYRHVGGSLRKADDLLNQPDMKWLRDTYGHLHELDHRDKTEWYWFDLKRDSRLDDFRGKLVIGAKATRAYVRLGNSLRADVLTMCNDGSFDAGPPSWRRMRLSSGMLSVLPPSWVDSLGLWNGIYLITDQRNGAQTVAATEKDQSLLSAFQRYAYPIDGGKPNDERRDTRQFSFRILECQPCHLAVKDASKKKQIWTERLRIQSPCWDDSLSSHAVVGPWA